MISCYIHIPFCEKICSYCDFCKMFYNEKLVDQYLDELEREIDFLYKGEVIKTLYIGGGTPSSLNIKQLKRLFEITSKFKRGDNCEFTIECNFSNTQTYEVLLWIRETKSDQTEADSGKIFAAGLNFTSAQGSVGVTGIISTAQAPSTGQ